MLSVDNSVNVSGATVALTAPSQLSQLQGGDMIVLIDNTSGQIVNDGTVIKTLLLDYDFLVSTTAAGYLQQFLGPAFGQRRR